MSHIIVARNVNDALVRGIDFFSAPPSTGKYREVSPRGMRTLEADGPVITEYLDPMRRVLFSETRDANPFFHLFEALWILAGRDDVGFLSYFNARMKDYSDDGVKFNAPYGHRLRNHPFVGDQLHKVVDILKGDPDSRRAVATIWYPDKDLRDSKDVPCNDMVMFKIRDGKLNMTVKNRSNDILWGAYGANAVQFAFILEYVASALGVPPGKYYQVSDSYHVYLDGPGGDLFAKLSAQHALLWDDDLYEFDNSEWVPIGGAIPFDVDLMRFFELVEASMGTEEIPAFKTDFFTRVVQPMWMAYAWHKRGYTGRGMDCLTDLGIDWQYAAHRWLSRRIK